DVARARLGDLSDEGQSAAVRGDRELIVVAGRPDRSERLAAPVDPGELPLADELATQPEDPGGRDGQTRKAARADLADRLEVLRQEHRLAGQPEGRRVERPCEQVAIPGVEEIAGSGIERLRSGAEQDRLVGGVDRTDADRLLLRAQIPRQ